MSKEFAEHIIDSMVDENGYCGERGLSEKQFDILSEYLQEGREYDAGCWEGDYATVGFWSRDYEGDIGKYHVKLNIFKHFNYRFMVEEISLRPADEVKAEREEKRRMAELRDFSHSKWMYEPKQRVELSLTMVSDYTYEYAYCAYDSNTCHIYTFRDDDGNCYVWKTSKAIGMDVRDDDGRFIEHVWAEPSDKVTMKATVKEHGEYRGTRQTVLTRATVLSIG